MRSTEGPAVWVRLGTLAAAALIAVTACGSNATTGGSTAAQPPTYNIKPPTTMPTKGEGALSLIDWPGYVDRTNWQSPSVASFEQTTGCKISVKDANTSDEMVTLMKDGGGGQYDMVSASGDADLRLIYGGDVKPMNTDLIPDFKSFQTYFKAPPYNTISGIHYGISLSGDPTRCFTTRPSSPPRPRAGASSTTRPTRAW